ncbi:chemotaxis response regulator protein-glutamate methylesterase [Lysobacter soli]|jgi:two-component system, chemotaxis family, protein-glutamate methylesterase/glutaminase|uniref:Protein-glutamate methylesterase/protein-glutamine glutaminase n=1 Tax=Lysobacter soli TaxID=453783 RepID=A0A3D8V7F7_9GAMM|nr:chemotaxis response regulator protein-glutamate methylesterase [Lysobacter soli]MDG2519816.1 chemotaxis response regulator protein-glutamate methylesterase [Lysobacter soli]RDY65325.1 chemotaxis response regulator protein-glutamate methylesterase [Lysobacter soli]UTA55354.1 chemotaxis response regulator protein-glutamate methylesterase [Lysobacter soli]
MNAVRLSERGNPAARGPIRVLVVDDSALVRQLMTQLLEEDPGIRVVGSAADPYIARDKIKQLDPDVLTLDVEMPRMDGLTFLRNLMRLRPMPVVMVSTLTERGAQVTLDALALGAVDFIAKPKLDVARGLTEYAGLLIEKIKQAAKARVVAPAPVRAGETIATPPVAYRTTHRLIAIGASTGGTEAIREVLSQMPADAPATVIAQHIPGAFSAPFADRLDRHSRMTVIHVERDQELLPGHAYVAPGGRHLRVYRSGARWHCRLGDDDPVRRHRPSVDALFDSVAEHVGANASAALLTGMGDDGARGLLALRKAGAATIAQDEASSVVWGMPGAAVALGAAQETVPLSLVAQKLLAGTAHE